VKEELDKLREEDRLTPELVFRDTYLLDFLGLKDTYSEKDLEQAVLREIEPFILELGTGFSFVARQKRMTIGDIGVVSYQYIHLFLTCCPSCLYNTT